MKQIKLDNVTIEISDEQYQELLKSAKPKTKRWKPELDQKYWYVDIYGDMAQTSWGYEDGCGSEIDKHRYDTDNCYKTETEAEAHKAYLEAMTRIKYSSEFVPDWSDKDQYKWHIYYHHADNKLDTDYYNLSQFTVLVYYATKEEALEAIKDYGDDYLTILNIKK